MQRMWWLNLIRGSVALIVGILILGWPSVGGRLFVNFLAIFWLASGLMSLQWGLIQALQMRSALKAKPVG